MTIFDCTSQDGDTRTLDVDPTVVCGACEHETTSITCIYVVIPSLSCLRPATDRTLEQLMFSYRIKKEDEEYFSRSYLPFWFVALILHPIIFASQAVAFVHILVKIW